MKRHSFLMRVGLTVAAIFWCAPTLLPSLPAITDIIVHGNSLVKTDTILHRLPYRKGGRFDATKSSSAIEAVYSLGSFSQVLIEREDGENDTTTLHFTVTEKPLLTGVTFEGNKAISSKKLEEVIEAASLKTVDDETAARLAHKIKKEYRENDYHHIHIAPQVTLDSVNTHNAHLHFTIDEQVKTHIRRVNFRGNTIIPARVLRTFLQSRENWIFGFLNGAGKFDEEVLEIDKERIRMAYADRGYFAARVTDTALTYTADNRHINLLFTVQEGPCFTVSSIDIAPEPDIPHGLLTRTLSLRAGDVYKQSELHKMMEAIKKVYGEFGYIDAHVAPQVIPNEQTKDISIKFHVDKGKKWRLNRLLIRGNNTTRDHVIRRHIMLEEGRPLTTGAMDASKRAVEYLSYFDREGLSWHRHPLDNDLMDLELRVKEVPTREVNMGLDFGPSKENAKGGLKGFFSANFRNMFGQGWDTGMNMKVAKKTATKLAEEPLTKSLNAADKAPVKADKKDHGWSGFPFEISQLSWHISDPYLLGSNASGALSVSYSKSVLDTWQWVDPVPQEHVFGITGRLGFRVPNAPAVSVLFETGFENISNNNTQYSDGRERLNIVNVHRDSHVRYRMLLDQKLQPGSLGWFGVDVVKDTRNHMMYPNDGYRLAWSTKVAPPGFNKTFSFAKSTLDASWYTPLIGYDTLVLGLHAFGGYVEQVGPQSSTTSKSMIPYRELFNMGGHNTIRGFNWGQAGPSWDYANPLGGKKALQVNAELIFPLFDNYDMKVHLFYDAGCAWDTPITPTMRPYESVIKSNSFNMRHTIGLGLNITRPQPIKLSFGYKLDRNKRLQESPHEFHIGMNTAF